MTNEIATVGINTELLFQKAIESGAGVDALERLMAMRRELKEEFSKESFFRSLSKFQFECPEIIKDKKVMDKTGNKVRFSYAPLDSIIKVVKEPLKNNGFSYTIETQQDKDSVTAICSLHHVDGYTKTANFKVPIDPGGYMNEPQKVATALTYSKRYAFCNATGIMTADQDNDANGLTKKATPEQEKHLRELAKHKNMPEVNKDNILRAVDNGLTVGLAQKWIERAEAKIK